MHAPTHKKNNWIPVVAGIIKNQNKVLLGQRPKDKSLAGLWEFPGGKIETGESPEEALHRELQEELDIDAVVGELKFATTHNYGDVGVVLLFFEVDYWKGQPKALHHSQIKWAEPKELQHFNTPEANRKVLNHLTETL